jgi:hypothetical protein
MEELHLKVDMQPQRLAHKPNVPSRFLLGSFIPGRWCGYVLLCVLCFMRGVVVRPKKKRQPATYIFFFPGLEKILVWKTEARGEARKKNTHVRLVGRFLAWKQGT